MLFQDVCYYLSNTLPVDKRSELAKTLDLNGALAVSFDDPSLTHYITHSIPNQDSLEPLPQSSTALLVSPFWAERALALGQPCEAVFYSPSPAMLFSGIVATATDLSQSDNEVLCAGISSLGGQWRSALTRDVTHLFAMTTGSTKYETAMHYKDSTMMKVVTPHWFDDVVRLGMRGLPTTEYEFPDPPVFRNFGAQAVKNLTVGPDGVEGTRSPKKIKPLTPSKKALYDTALTSSATELPSMGLASNTVWNGMKIMLGSSLELNDSQRYAHEVDIRRGGGVVVKYRSSKEEVEKMDVAEIYITRYRAGPAFVKAYRLNKTIGTLPWFWYVRSTGVLSRPTDQLLHYPVPKTHVEGFDHHVITITNYTGKDREYIKRLIMAMGGEFTPSMSGRNTSVVAAYVSGTKTAKATSWSIPIVNHLWLEDCFTHWTNVPSTNEKYVAFPPGVDFGALLTERGYAMGRVVYDEADLNRLEKEETQQEGNGREKENLDVGASQPMPESPRKGKKPARDADEHEAAQYAERRRGGDEDGDVPMAADISAGGYLDIDVPIDDDGRLSDYDPDISNSQQQQRREEEMDIDESPSRRAAGRKIAASAKKGSRKSPVRAKSILKKGRTKARLPDSDEDEAGQERELEDLPPSSPERSPKQSRRLGKTSPARAAPTPSMDEDEEVQISSKPLSSVKERMQQKGGKAAKNGKKATAMLEGSEPELGRGHGREPEPSSKLKKPVTRTYRTKSRSRSRSRPRPQEMEEESEEEVEEISPPKTQATTKSPMKPTSKPTRADSRRRGIREASSDEEVEDMPPVKKSVPTDRTGRSRSRGRTERKGNSDSRDMEVEKVRSIKHTSARMIMTRSRSRSRARGSIKASDDDNDDEGESKKPRGRKPTVKAVTKTQSKSKSKPIVVDEDTEMGDAEEVARSLAKGKSKSKHPTAAPTTTERKRPVFPTDSEGSEKETPKRVIRRIHSRASIAETDNEPMDKSGRTPRRDVSVVVPTLKQVRSQSQIRGENEAKGSPQPKQPSTKKSLERTESVDVRARDSPEKSPPKRGRPASRALKITRAPSSSLDRSPSPTRPAPSKKPRPVEAATSKAGPSKVTETPSTIARTQRSAATKATNKLRNEIMPDVMNFQKELKSGNVKSAYDTEQASAKAKGKGKEKEGTALAASAQGKKRVSIGDGEAELSEKEEPEKKKRKTGKGNGRKSDVIELSADEDVAVEVAKGRRKPDIKTSATADRLASHTDVKNVVVMTTQVALPEDVVKAFTKMGAKFTQKPSECTHLVARSLVRTEKFLCAMATAPYVVTDAWVETCVSKNRIMPEEDFALKDPTSEKKYGFKLLDAIERSKANAGKVFAGKTFYLTPKVPVESKLLKNVVTAGGGQLLIQSPTARILKGHDNRFVISSPADVSIWRPLSEQGYPIYNQELVLTAMLKQQIDWDNESNKVPGSF
ncbi:hypothetical protein PHLCEN_2v4098 [Hermanssonia centrifuga]|uniref:BRCT domain-containing protein n=1 Tax=Hermanssonia centrifuga TaxID=98765 RepID=A0A2R6Q2A7_9APHY|nr:hypothetical protein PHLCEN_2v4098 [Hermanssonia centrifuga]